MALDSQNSNAQALAPRPVSVAVLDFAGNGSGKLVSDLIASKLVSPSVTVMDRDMSRTAARGAGYQGSLNMSVTDARDLGAAIGCDFYVIGDSQTVRRSPSTGAPYFEAYASIFLVSSRTGKLISWQRPNSEAPNAEAAAKQLLSQLSKDEVRHHYLNLLEQARGKERQERELTFERNAPIIEDSGAEESDATGLRSPRPYRRLKPAYPDTAASADASGTVDVLVDLDQEGEISQMSIARWAGFGMDEAALDTVRQLHFFPASRDGIAIPIRVLLRYNFRQPAK